MKSKPSDPITHLLHSKPTALSDADLLTVALTTSGPSHRTHTLATELLETFGSLAGLAEAKTAIQTHPGMTPRRSASLLATLELGCRFAKATMPERQLLAYPKSVARYLTLRYGQRDQEIMGALYLDSDTRLILDREVFRGRQKSIRVEPRALLKEGLILGATSFILFHTHPGGDPTPSVEDVEFTQRMTEAADLVGIKLVDHLILGGGGRWLSFKQHRLWR